MISLFDIILHELTCLLSRIQYGGQFTVEPLFTILQLWILHANNSQWKNVLYNSWIMILIIVKSQMSSISGCHVLSRNCLPFRSTWVHPRFLVGVARPFVFCIIFCRSLSDLFLLAIILSVLFFELRLLVTCLRNELGSGWSRLPSAFRDRRLP